MIGKKVAECVIPRKRSGRGEKKSRTVQLETILQVKGGGGLSRCREGRLWRGPSWGGLSVAEKD